MGPFSGCLQRQFILCPIGIAFFWKSNSNPINSLNRKVLNNACSLCSNLSVSKRSARPDSSDRCRSTCGNRKRVYLIQQQTDPIYNAEHTLALSLSIHYWCEASGQHQRPQEKHRQRIGFLIWRWRPDGMKVNCCWRLIPLKDTAAVYECTLVDLKESF